MSFGLVEEWEEPLWGFEGDEGLLKWASGFSTQVSEPGEEGKVEVGEFEEGVSRKEKEDPSDPDEPPDRGFL